MGNFKIPEMYYRINFGKCTGCTCEKCIQKKSETENPCMRCTFCNRMGFNFNKCSGYKE